MVPRRLLPIMLAALAGIAVSCSGSGGGGSRATGAPAPPTRESPSPLDVSSAAWPARGTLRPPTACSRSGDHGRSPALAWSAGPAGTRYYAVTVIDTDAHNFLHWAALNLPASERTLAAGSHDSADQLRNDFGYTGYGAPCPPKGTTHHYRLAVWALPGTVSSLDELHERALAEGSVTATYGR